MQGFFWFFLGGLVYLVYHSLNSLFYKAKFINETKIHSIKLIGYAYEQLVFSMTAKYISLEQSDISKEKIKLFKNTKSQKLNYFPSQTNRCFYPKSQK